MFLHTKDPRLSLHAITGACNSNLNVTRQSGAGCEFNGLLARRRSSLVTEAMLRLILSASPLPCGVNKGELTRASGDLCGPLRRWLPWLHARGAMCIPYGEACAVRQGIGGRGLYSLEGFCKSSCPMRHFLHIWGELGCHCVEPHIWGRRSSEGLVFLCHQ